MATTIPQDIMDAGQSGLPLSPAQCEALKKLVAVKFPGLASMADGQLKRYNASDVPGRKKLFGMVKTFIR